VDEGDIPIHVFTGVRGVNLENPFANELFPSLANASSDELPRVVLSKSLYDLLFSDRTLREGKEAWREKPLYLKAQGGRRVLFAISDVLFLMNNERWLIFSDKTLRENRLLVQPARILTLYTPQGVDNYEKLQAALPSLPLNTWSNLLPFQFQTLWAVTSNGLQVLAFCVSSIIGLYLFNLSLMILAEFQTGLYLLRIYGIAKARFIATAGLVYFVSLVIGTLTAAAVAAGLVGLIDLPQYMITTSAFLDYLQANDYSAPGFVAISTAVWILPTFYMAWVFFRPDPSRIWILRV
jgi:hypothetical protein